MRFEGPERARRMAASDHGAAREPPVRVERAAPPERADRSANAALTSSAIQHLQRMIGNRAVGQLLRRPAVRRVSSGTAVVQRVGGEKIGFDLPSTTDATVKAGQGLLADEWRKIRQTEHDLKVGAEKTEVEGGAQEFIDIRKREKARVKWKKEYKNTNPTAKEREIKAAVDKALPVIPAVTTTGKGFTKYYYDKLTGRTRTQQLALLQTAPPFADARLTIDDATGVINYRSDSTQPYVVIGTLKKGADAFKVKTAATDTSATRRDVIEKQGVSTDLSNDAKEYVKDTRGVLTRRYAYVEKNYWQMMEFFMTRRHEGRFQSFMKAAGEANPDLFEARQPDVDIVRGEASPSKTGRLTNEQLAVAHQKLGSGPQQRGVSLTSTPKVGVTYVNTGENFRTPGGFRLKIDLALIPPHPTGPLLINHYSHGGVSDTPDKYETKRKRGQTSTYPYKESALHARELYLEYLKPEWVVAIEAHPDATAPGTTIDRNSPLGTATSLFELGKSMFGGAAFGRGFDEGLGNAPNSLPGDENHTKGFNQAKSFVLGWTDGRAEHTKVGGNDVTAGAAEGVTVPQYVYDQSMKAPLPKDHYDIYRLGYLQGRSGVAQITTGANLPH